MEDKLERIVKFEEGYDCIRFECVLDSARCKPYSGGSHGVHGLSIRFVVKGKDGAVQFVVCTGWLPQYASSSSVGRRYNHEINFEVLPVDLGYHSKTPRYKGQPAFGSCPYCDGEVCYYDGSGLNANDAMYTLVNGGDEAIWKFLEEYYHYVFRGGDYPIPTEYKKPLRKEE